MGNKLYEEISNAEYRAREGISSSDLKKMMKSMATYKYYKDHPEDSDSEALLFGRAYHSFILENEKFDNEYLVIRDFNCGNAEGKKAYAEYIEGIIGRSLTDAEKKYKDAMTTALINGCGKDIISKDTYEKLKEMRNVFMKTPYAPLLIEGEHEKSFFWVDEKSGIKCKCRPDSFGQIKGQYVCIDLKTTKNAETDAFMRDSIKLGYDIQASHYVEGLKNTYGKDFKFLFIAQEKTAPYLVNVLEADEYFMQSGRELRDLYLDQYRECLETDNWYGLMGKDGEISSLGVPKWLENSMMLDDNGEGDFE